MMNAVETRAARFSLVAVWVWTAVASVQQLHGISRDLLAASSVVPPHLYPAVILSGAAVDLLLGLWMWFRPSMLAYLAAGGMTLLMTVVGTVIDPTLWLHPLGPLSKNLPIVVMLWMLARDHGGVAS